MVEVTKFDASWQADPDSLPQSLLVHDNGSPDAFEIVAGQRRRHAAKTIAGEGLAVENPALRHHDAAALEASLIENIAGLGPNEVSQWETFTLLKAGRKGGTPVEKRSRCCGCDRPWLVRWHEALSKPFCDLTERAAAGS
ncbi:chromosome partitioning protein ParB [Allomesorhizobium alhagi]|uniref:ParB-like partition protein n=1 Tax=Mesorhizobium alhagi CCNWXJ12-2 TaxID=1107882 RepID=H0HXH9_9HYPH|nr:chromosome partitioning protein ParB [Mesorhizobium alhagi]EHK54590.1 parB-like partition protein [Mesorhizobium alhagi CCNWXJ12-2]